MPRGNRNRICRRQMARLLATLSVGDEFTLDDFHYNMSIKPPTRTGKPRVLQPRQRVATLLQEWVRLGFLERCDVRSGSARFYVVLRSVEDDV